MKIDTVLWGIQKNGKRKWIMYDYAIVKQVKRKQKAMTGALRKLMIVFAVIFVLLGIAVSQGFMLPGFLLIVLYFGYDVYS